MANALTGHESLEDEVIMTELKASFPRERAGNDIRQRDYELDPDIAGAIAAQRHLSKDRSYRRSIDDLAFLAGVKVRLVCSSSGRESISLRSEQAMEVGVRVDAEDPRTGTWYHTASCVYDVRSYR